MSAELVCAAADGKNIDCTAMQRDSIAAMDARFFMNMTCLSKESFSAAQGGSVCGIKNKGGKSVGASLLRFTVYVFAIRIPPF